MIRNYRDFSPKIHARAWIAESAQVIGDVTIGADSSVWFQAVIRGDVHHIRIGERTNIQDHTTVHVTGGRNATILHDDVTVGHRVVLHGCTVESGALIGIGAIILDGAVVGEGAMIAAGGLVTPGTEIPPGMVAMGAPAKVVREVTEEERTRFLEGARSYITYARNYSLPGP